MTVELDSIQQAKWAFDEGQVLAMIHGGAQGVFERASGLDEAVKTHDGNCLCCMDDRIPGSCCAAGSGVFAGIDETCRAVERWKIDAISSHRYCAAVRLFVSRINSVTLPPEELDKIAEEVAQGFALKVSEKTGIKYAGHLDPEDYGYSSKFHPAELLFIHLFLLTYRKPTFLLLIL